MITTPTSVLRARAAHTHQGLRPHQLLSFDQNAITIHIDKDHPYIHRQLQKAGRAIDQLGILNPALTGDWTFDEQWAFQLGFSRFNHPGHISLAMMDDSQNKKFITLTEIWHWIRARVNAGPSQCPPEVLARAAVELIEKFAQTYGYSLKIEWLEGEELQKQGFVGCYSVGRGSEFPPVLLSIKIYPKGQEGQKIKGAVIGKGITFDSGGYILKGRESGIGYMKCDMGGAATVTGAMALAMSEGLSHPAELILCCAENLISGKAYRPGDVLTFKNGLKVEILNTDAEGRIVLADGFLKAQEAAPEFILDAATLTGAAKTAVGNDFAAVFSLDRAVRERALQYASECCEGLWPLPLEIWHQEAYPSIVADTLNADLGSGGTMAGASAAAGFLSRFVNLSKQKWLHYDLSSVYTVTPNNLWAGGATGLMLRSLALTFRKELAQ